MFKVGSVTYKGRNVYLLIPKEVATYMEAEGSVINEETLQMLAFLFPEWVQFFLSEVAQMEKLNRGSFL